MEIYEVGGCVRDRLLGLVPKDIDRVVVGASEKDMFDQGFTQVGLDFPVFLHPQTGEEYALARTERKSARGYHGFTVATQGVTLEEDLSRRDLTINAMAMDKDGKLVDPFDGAGDIQRKLLRHVGPAFSEDPLRILRVLRLHARLGPTWTVHPQTEALMQEMVANGEARFLVPARVWKEFSRAMMEPNPELFLDGMLRLGLNRLLAFSAYQAVDAESVYLSQSPAFASASLEVKVVVGTKMDTQALPNIRTPAPAIPVSVWRLARLVHSFPQPPGDDSLDWHGVVHASGERIADVFKVWELRGMNLGPAQDVLNAYQAVDTKSITASMPAGPEVGKAIAQARIQAIKQVLTQAFA